MDFFERSKNNFYVDDDGVVRWQTNDRVPFPDMLQKFREAGLITDEQVTTSCLVRERENELAVAAYRQRMADHVPDDEELFEMRAAFGSGTTVVNVLTGRRTKL